MRGAHRDGDEVKWCGCVASWIGRLKDCKEGFGSGVVGPGLGLCGLGERREEGFYESTPTVKVNDLPCGFFALFSLACNG